jgi:hypothetical protein
MRFLLIVLACACGSKESSQPPAAGSGSAAGKDFVALLTAHAKPTLVGPFAKLTVSTDMTIGDARRIAPDLLVETNVIEGLDWYAYTAEAYEGVSVRTERFGQIDSPPDTWLVGRLRAVFLHGKPDLEATLAKAWGAPRKLGRRALWFDAPAHLRCMLWNSDGRDTPKDSLVLDCGRYVPLAELIGTDKALFGFEDGQPLLGMTKAAVQKRWGRRAFEEGRVIMLPPTELAERATTILTGDYVVPETITWYTLSLSADQNTIAALLDAKFGKPAQDPQLPGDVYRTKPRIVFMGSQVTVGTK